MLAKLVKHEWNYIGKKYLLFLGVTLLGTIIGCISGNLFASLGESGSFGKAIAAMMGFMVYYTIVIAASVGFSVLLAIRFYKNVYGNQGYITHTLPVTARQIYGSHLIVYGICTAILTLVMMFGMMLVSDRMFSSALFSSSDEMAQVMTGSLGFRAFGISSVGEGFLLAGFVIVATVCSLTLLYGCIVLGQYWRRHKIWGAIVSYLIVETVITIVYCAILIPYMVVRMINFSGPATEIAVLPSSFWVISGLISLFFGAVMFLIMDHGMVKRLNLE